MNYKELKALADDDSLTSKTDPDNGIVALRFAVNGVRWTAQYGSTIQGIYAFSLECSSDDQAELVLTALKNYPAAIQAIEAANKQAES